MLGLNRSLQPPARGRWSQCTWWPAPALGWSRSRCPCNAACRSVLRNYQTGFLTARAHLAKTSTVVDSQTNLYFIWTWEQTLPRHILCCELIQSWNFQTAIIQSFLKSKFMKKSVDIENCLASSKMQKYF